MISIWLNYLKIKFNKLKKNMKNNPYKYKYIFYLIFCIFIISIIFYKLYKSPYWYFLNKKCDIKINQPNKFIKPIENNCKFIKNNTNSETDRILDRINSIPSLQKFDKTDFDYTI